MPTHTLRYIAVMGLLLSGCAKTELPSGPASEDALRALDRAYAEAWLAPSQTNQERAVLALFDRSAVIMPDGAAGPEEGVASLRQFWFPDDAPSTTVTHFEREIDDIEIEGALGVVSGRYILSFSFGGRDLTQKGNYVLVARYGGGAWKIRRMIWNDAPLSDV
ncbi:MAG: nuclear transport factor 2 family protein [Parvularculaceae bacterium]|nr:nuclear transport factor 2 family protein [Parvularculaceae bacterium]